MGAIELCMKYDTCLRCPNNALCEYEYRKELEQKQHSKEEIAKK